MQQNELHFHYIQLPDSKSKAASIIVPSVDDGGTVKNASRYNFANLI